jgi:hypothetical protein
MPVIVEPPAENVLQFGPTDTKVGQVRNDGLWLIAPVPKLEQKLL